MSSNIKIKKKKLITFESKMTHNHMYMPKDTHK